MYLILHCALHILYSLFYSAAGYKAIFLTVDCPIIGIRHNEYRNDLTIPEGFGYPNLSADPSKPYGLGEQNPEVEYGMDASLKRIPAPVS